MPDRLPAWAGLLPLAGMVMVLLSFIFLDFGRHHPGFLTMIPVAGTMMLIGFTGASSLLARVLSSRAMVYLGLLSYSIYLWHYPIFAFGRMATLQPGWIDKVCWIVLTLVLSALTYHFVEKPFRRGRISLRVFLGSVSSATLLVLLLCAYWIVNDGLPDRVGYLQGLIRSSEQQLVYQEEVNCLSLYTGKGDALNISESCVFGYSPGSPTIVLVGDSHAGAIGESVRALAQENQLNYVQVTEAGCPHLLGQATCEDRSEALRQYISQFEKPTIIYSARTPIYLEQRGYDEPDGLNETRRGWYWRGVLAKTPAEWAQSLTGTLSGWVSEGYGLVIVYPVPEQGFHVVQRLKRFYSFASSAAELPTYTTSYEKYLERTAASYAALDQVEGAGVKRVYPEKIFCRKESGVCVASEADRVYIPTDNHVGRLGSDLIVRQIAEELNLKIPNHYRQ